MYEYEYEYKYLCVHLRRAEVPARGSRYLRPASRCSIFSSSDSEDFYTVQIWQKFSGQGFVRYATPSVRQGESSFFLLVYVYM